MLLLHIIRLHLQLRNLVQDIRSIVRRFKNIVFCHCCRKTDKIADYMVKKTHRSNLPTLAINKFLRLSYERRKKKKKKDNNRCISYPKMI